MAFLKRIFFFALTNIAVLTLFTIVMMIVQMVFPGLQNARGGYMYMLVYAAIFGFLGSFVSLWISRWSAKKMYNIQLLDAQSAAADSRLQIVWNTVERIARENDINMPEVGYYESADPNAFATGATKNSSLVAVSTGLLEVMELGEIEGVVGHEMAHILNGDMVTLTLIQGVMNTFVVFLSQVIARAIDSWLSDENGEGMGWLAYNLVYMLLQIVFGFLASLVVMYFSRYREYRADEGGARFTSKKKMIAGLQKLKKLSSMPVQVSEENAEANKKMAAFMISEPDSMFSTHPSLDNRIKALEENIQLA